MSDEISLGDMVDAMDFLNQGSRDIKFLEAGPHLWAHMPSAEIRPDKLADWIAATLETPDEALQQSFVETKRRFAHAYVDALVDALEAWARDHGRTDLLRSISDRLDSAVKEDPLP